MKNPPSILHMFAMLSNSVCQCVFDWTRQLPCVCSFELLLAVGLGNGTNVQNDFCRINSRDSKDGCGMSVETWLLAQACLSETDAEAKVILSSILDSISTVKSDRRSSLTSSAGFVYHPRHICLVVASLRLRSGGKHTGELLSLAS